MHTIRPFTINHSQLIIIKELLKNKNFIINGWHGKPMLTDIFYINNGKPKPVVIYAHGFNGFKDWGNFDLIATQFAEAGFVFIKFNFSHNGTTPEHPEEFVDLEAYGNDNYSIELDDLKTIIDWTVSKNDFSEEIDQEKISLIGHSKGGGMVLLKAAEDERIKAVATWAAVSVCKTPWGSWPAEKMQAWEETGVQYIMNSRTKQNLPLYYQLYEDFQSNQERLDIQKAISKLNIPILICHGTTDTSVSVESAYSLHHWQPNSELFLVDSDHVFGRKHPWTEEKLPKPMQEVVDKTIGFLK